MCRQPPSLRFPAGQILAWVIVLAISMLWQPRVGSRPAGSPAASQMQAQLFIDKSQGPRGSYLQRQPLDDRLPQGLGALLTPPFAGLPERHPHARLIERAPALAWTAGAIKGLPQPRAPPVRYAFI